MGEEVRALGRTNRYLQNSHEEAKCGIGNGDSKEHIRMTHGHEQWCGDFLSWFICLVERGKEEEIGKILMP